MGISGRTRFLKDSSARVKTRTVQTERRAVQVRGTISMTAPGIARYDVELLMSGKPAASARTILNFPPSK
jgi:hypothetical protein